MTAKDLKKIMEKEASRVKSLSFHPTKPVIISGHHSGSIKAWDYQMGVCIHEFLDHDGSVRAVLFHPRGDFFVSGGDDKVIRVWSYTERRITNKLRGHDDFIRSLDFHPTKPWILSASDDQTIMVWNMLTGKLLATARGHCHYVMAAKFLGEESIVSGSLDQSIRIWDCKGLKEGGKKNSLLPDIVIKQIVDGHDRGINAIAAKDGVFVSGGDDRDIKCWEWSETSVWEKEVMYNHQGPVTGLLCDREYVLSSGEDGLFSIYNTETRKSIERRTEGRYWCVANKGNLYAAGHDSGFEVYIYSEPKIICTHGQGFFYLKNSRIHYSDFKTEKVLLKPKKDVTSICAKGEYLLVQYDGKFNVLIDGKVVVEESGEGDLFENSEGDVELIVKNEEGAYRGGISSRNKHLLSSSKGSLFPGSNEFFFLVNGRSITMCFVEGEEKTFNIPFHLTKIVCSNSRISFVGNNDILIYNLDLSPVNSINEIVPIIDGFFHEDIFIYATHRHLKYAFEDSGVLKSIEKPILPFALEEGKTIYFLSDDGIECVDVELIEVKFKKAVLMEEDIAPLIEEGAMPGLSPLSYLVRQKKGALALPYIKDRRQRFELCLSDLRLDECMEYCIQEGDVDMNRRLADAAIRECRVDIAERCLESTREWNMLFMLYVCSRDDEKIRELAEKVDPVTKNMIMMYLEDVEYFKKTKVIGEYKGENGNKNPTPDVSSWGRGESKEIDFQSTAKNDSDFFEISPSSNDIPQRWNYNEKDDVQSEDEIHSDLSETEEKWNERSLPVDEKSLQESAYLESSEGMNEILERGLSLTTEGKFGKAIEAFREGMVKIALYIRDNNASESFLEERRKIGSYISGLVVEKIRRKTDSPLKNIMMAKYFSELPLEKEHHVLASSTAIMVFRKNGNLKQAKELAMELRKEGKDSKVIEKAIEEENPKDEHELPEGVFCHDILETRTSAKTCLLCFVNSSSGNICTSCRVGVLQ
ncbi:WD40 repeat-containing coatomer complex protein [Encephalitozoon intestinalis ATCC 50506]|uniref:WD40 repeat-containing coatomer complex protein n=1 Tax=Encephalitozoon intestinalis (strain ATCC 50506) TaxID=876142 RepID=E0S5J9_ENCIT|nr:WD40 repeat-containing coatomer complex protein [Encephalitozoon intestinalis ATCC 50506]ADM10984.1 WD40 repeat-containing coatomer complex protein [Encephalitozoon intestinalis ATCC 50506]UTX44621.1 WD40 repeat-containing protein [Encephalitozoon intestinalis]